MLEVEGIMLGVESPGGGAYTISPGINSDVQELDGINIAKVKCHYLF